MYFVVSVEKEPMLGKIIFGIAENIYLFDNVKGWTERDFSPYFGSQIQQRR